MFGKKIFAVFCVFILVCLIFSFPGYCQDISFPQSEIQRYYERTIREGLLEKLSKPMGPKDPSKNVDGMAVSYFSSMGKEIVGILGDLKKIEMIYNNKELDDGKKIKETKKILEKMDSSISSLMFDYLGVANYIVYTGWENLSEDEKFVVNPEKYLFDMLLDVSEGNSPK